MVGKHCHEPHIYIIGCLYISLLAQSHRNDKESPLYKTNKRTRISKFGIGILDSGKFSKPLELLQIMAGEAGAENYCYDSGLHSCVEASSLI